MILLIHRFDAYTLLLNRGNSAESFAFEKLLDDFFGIGNWKVKQSFTRLYYSITNYSDYEITVIMKALSIATKGKITYVNKNY